MPKKCSFDFFFLNPCTFLSRFVFEAFKCGLGFNSNFRACHNFAAKSIPEQTKRTKYQGIFEHRFIKMSVGMVVQLHPSVAVRRKEQVRSSTKYQVRGKGTQGLSESLCSRGRYLAPTRNSSPLAVRSKAQPRVYFCNMDHDTVQWD
jgi:hypothetical protein